MTLQNFTKYIAKLYDLKTNNPLVEQAITMAITSFGSMKPWTFTRAIETLTTDSDGIIKFDREFDGVFTMREKDSTAGSEITVWMEEKFDYEAPRLDNLSGSYPVVCKIYQEDGSWYGQMAPPVASMSIYVTYKKKVKNISDIPEKFLPGIVATAHTLLIKPTVPGYVSAVGGLETVIRGLWKQDRQIWAKIFKTADVDTIRKHMKWWGPWVW